MVSCIFVLIILIPDSVFVCTIFTAAKGGQVLSGNNEYYHQSNTLVWVFPSSEGKYGSAFFDWALLPPRPDIVFPRDKPMNDGIITEEMLTSWTTVGSH